MDKGLVVTNHTTELTGGREGGVLGDPYRQASLPEGGEDEPALQAGPDVGWMNTAGRPGVYQGPSLCQEPRTLCSHFI